MSRTGDTILPEPLAYFLTWTTYGTWLPGDERGWVKRKRGFQAPDMSLHQSANAHERQGMRSHRRATSHR